MSTQRLRITGMTCDHCARSIEEVLNALPGVKASVSYEAGTAQVEAPSSLTIEALLQVVKAKGFGTRLLKKGKKPDAPIARSRAGGEGAGAGPVGAGGAGALHRAVLCRLPQQRRCPHSRRFVGADRRHMLTVAVKRDAVDCDIPQLDQRRPPRFVILKRKHLRAAVQRHVNDFSPGVA